MINPVLEKAPDFDMNLANAVTPSAVPRIVDKAKDREASLRIPRCCGYLGSRAFSEYVTP